MQNNTIEHNEIFDLAYRFVTETAENIFLTGNAGTGKTTFLKYLKENCSKNIVVAAPTGVAAINAGGVTLHSLFQLPFHPFIPAKNQKEELLAKLRFNKPRQELLRKMELLVIDEISMVRCDTLDAIDTILRSVRRNYNAPFGGVQLLCIGDLYQLPPVAQREEWNLLQEYYASPFFFDSRVIKDQMPILIELQKIYRQKEDSFIDLLNKVRNNNMEADDFEALHLRYDPLFRPSSVENYITLTSHNNLADQINNRELQKLLGAPYYYNAVITDDFPENNYPAEGTLTLKTGAQVMFLKNDIQKRYFNGKIGVISRLDHEEIIVECDGNKISVTPETWEYNRYVVNREDGKLQQQTLGTFTQFPLRLAWAITIHKSQGLTFEKVMIDAASAFSSGQVYVALSRCTSLDGIVLLTKIPSSAIYSNENVIKGQQVMNTGSLAERFHKARQFFTFLLLEEIFSFENINTALDDLQAKIYEGREKLNSNAVTWLEELKNDFITHRNIGLKFIQKIAELMKEEPVIESNTALQKRINDATAHFLPKFITLYQQVLNHSLLTEHKDVAVLIDEQLSQLLRELHITNYYLEYCKQSFSVSSFLQHKLVYSRPRINTSCYATKKFQPISDIPNIELYESLKHWRNQVCEENGLPIYLVANQATLKEVSTYLPLTKKDLMMISGFGKAKADKYGDEIVGFVENYCSKNNIETNISAKAAHPKRERREKTSDVKTDTKLQSFNLFKLGKTIAEIAAERNLAVSTIEGHLELFVSTGELDLDNLVTLEKQVLIKAAAREHGTASTKTLKDNLPDEITYCQIRMVIGFEKGIVV